MNRSTRLVTRLYSPESPRFFLSLRRSTNTLAQFSTLRKVRFTASATANGPLQPHPKRPAMDPQSSVPDPPAADNFVHVENPTIEDLSDSIVGVDAPRDEYDDDVVSTSAAAESSDQRKVLPEELSRSVVVLTCESTAEGGVCDVHLVGTAHVSVVRQFRVWLVRKFESCSIRFVWKWKAVVLGLCVVVGVMQRSWSSD